MRRADVAPVSFGLGDLVVSLPAVQGLIAAGWETRLVARTEVQARLADRIEGLAGVVRAEDLAREPGAARLFDLRDHPLQRDWWWGSPEFERAFGALAINDLLGRICADLGVPADFSQPRRLRFQRRPAQQGAVLLVAGSDGPSKRWPTGHWLQLADVLRRAGRAVQVVTGGGNQAEEELRAAGLAAAEAPTVPDAVDVLSSAAAVVGVDTGLCHLAVQQGTPTVVLHRHPAVFFRPWPRAQALVAAPCDPACLARARACAHNARVDLRGFSPRTWECAAAKGCLAAIEPSAVAAALDAAGIP